MVNVRLYNFNKRKNSTKRPDTASGGDLVQGEVKSDFTPLAPVITFNMPDPTAVPTYNYAYIAEFGQRCYFITDWLFVSGLWRATMAVDVLATYRDAIRASRQFVARSKTLNPGTLIDGNYPTLTTVVRSDNTITPTAFWGTDYYSGTIILSVVGSSGSNIGVNTYYAMSVPCFGYFMAAMLNSPNWLNISGDEISENLQKALINPTQYITSCIWIPVNWEQAVYYSGAPGSDLTKTIRCGWWDFGLPTGEGTGAYTARILHNPFVLNYDYGRHSAGWTLPKHPQAAQRGKWLNLSPYSRYTLAFPPFGVFELDTTDLVDATELNIRVTVHYYTGDATLIVSIPDPNFPTQQNELLRVNSNIAVQIPTGQIAMNLGNFDNALYVGAAAAGTELGNMFVEAVTADQTTRSTPSAHSSTSHSSRRK